MSPDAAPPPERRGRAWSWATQIALVLLVYFGVTRWQQSGLLTRGVHAPDFTLRTPTGDQVSLDAYRGKTVLVHFWATWCGVCRQEFGMLNRVHDALGADSVLLSIVEDGDNPDLRRFIDEQGIRYPVLLGTSKLLRDYKVGAFPTNYFIDSSGNVQDHTVGLSTEWTTRARLGCTR
ncbi:MAG TPA: TlpA disulfide reductase family protein [Polyangiaceae bacterium]|nr:TlpA disulfide reductase family protein [Polyangiaceae bacterium]